MQAKAWVMLADEMPWVVSMVSVELNWDKGSECDLLGIEMSHALRGVISGPRCGAG